MWVVVVGGAVGTGGGAGPDDGEGAEGEAGSEFNWDATTRMPWSDEVDPLEEAPPALGRP